MEMKLLGRPMKTSNLPPPKPSFPLQAPFRPKNRPLPLEIPLQHVPNDALRLHDRRGPPRRVPQRLHFHAVPELRYRQPSGWTGFVYFLFE